MEYAFVIYTSCALATADRGTRQVRAMCRTYSGHNSRFLFIYFLIPSLSKCNHQISKGRNITQGVPLSKSVPIEKNLDSKCTQLSEAYLLEGPGVLESPE